MKFLLSLFKKITLAFVMLYTYNLIGESINLIIPINFITIFIITLLDFPGLFLLVIMLKLFY